MINPSNNCFPQDIQLAIHSNLSPCEILNSSLVSKEWNEISKNPQLWKKLYKDFNLCEYKGPVENVKAILLLDFKKNQEVADKIISLLNDDTLSMLCPSMKLNEFTARHFFDRTFYIVKGIKNRDLENLLNRVAKDYVKDINHKISRIPFQTNSEILNSLKSLSLDTYSSLTKCIDQILPNREISFSEMFRMQEIMNALSQYSQTSKLDDSKRNGIQKTIDMMNVEL
jgi:hypothetical protein